MILKILFYRIKLIKLIETILFYNKINVKKSNIQKLKMLYCLTPISLEIDRNNGFLHIADFGSPDFANKKFILNGTFLKSFGKFRSGDG
jgi:hypothetical protein